MQRPTPYHTVATPVASRTRSGTAAAAARAASNTHQWIAVSGACKLALESRGGKLAEPAIQPTPDEIKAAIPEHGIMIHELFQLFIARLPTLDSLQAFVANFQSVAAQDPVDMLIFPITSSAVQSTSTFVSRLPPGASPIQQKYAADRDAIHALHVKSDWQIASFAWDLVAYKARRNAQMYQ